VFAKSRFQKLWSTPDVTRRINVFVFERMVDVTSDVHARYLAPPEEVPMLFDL
jgi:hypothetical protein